jgi:Flp pilus assembly protein CpaB
MNTAPLLVLTIAHGAGGAAVYLATGSHNKPLPTGPVVRQQTLDVVVAKRDIGRGDADKTSLDNQSPKRGDSVNVTHYGVSTPTRTLK